MMYFKLCLLYCILLAVLRVNSAPQFQNNGVDAGKKGRTKRQGAIGESGPADKPPPNEQSLENAVQRFETLLYYQLHPLTKQAFRQKFFNLTLASLPAFTERLLGKLPESAELVFPAGMHKTLHIAAALADEGSASQKEVTALLGTETAMPPALVEYSDFYRTMGLAPFYYLVAASDVRHETLLRQLEPTAHVAYLHGTQELEERMRSDAPGLLKEAPLGPRRGGFTLLHAATMDFQWEDRFRRSDAEHVFTESNGHSTQAKLMTAVITTTRASFNGAYAAVKLNLKPLVANLPALARRRVAYLIVPTHPTALTHLPAGLLRDVHTELTKQENTRTFRLAMPAFELSADFALQALPALLREGNEDFPLVQGRVDVDIQHRARLCADEEGTYSQEKHTPAETNAEPFVINKSFIVVLADEDTGAPLVVGKVSRAMAGKCGKALSGPSPPAPPPAAENAASVKQSEKVDPNKNEQKSGSGSDERSFNAQKDASPHTSVELSEDQNGQLGSRKAISDMNQFTQRLLAKLPGSDAEMVFPAGLNGLFQFASMLAHESSGSKKEIQALLGKESVAVPPVEWIRTLNYIVARRTEPTDTEKTSTSLNALVAKANLKRIKDLNDLSEHLSDIGDNDLNFFEIQRADPLTSPTPNVVGLINTASIELKWEDEFERLSGSTEFHMANGQVIAPHMLRAVVHTTRVHVPGQYEAVRLNLVSTLPSPVPTPGTRTPPSAVAYLIVPEKVSEGSSVRDLLHYDLDAVRNELAKETNRKNFSLTLPRFNLQSTFAMPEAQFPELLRANNKDFPDVGENASMHIRHIAYWCVDEFDYDGKKVETANTEDKTALVINKPFFVVIVNETNGDRLVVSKVIQPMLGPCGIIRDDGVFSKGGQIR